MPEGLSPRGRTDASSRRGDPGESPRLYGATNQRNREGEPHMRMRRRRPLMRAAMVGGTAYYAGKKVEQGRKRGPETGAHLEDLEAQQHQQASRAPPPPPPAPAPSQGIS